MERNYRSQTTIAVVSRVAQHSARSPATLYLLERGSPPPPDSQEFPTIRKRRYVNGTARAQEACHSVGLAECYICYICYIMTYTLRVRVLAVAYMR